MKRYRLTENRLRGIIRETVIGVLKEEMNTKGVGMKIQQIIGMLNEIEPIFENLPTEMNDEQGNVISYSGEIKDIKEKLMRLFATLWQ